MSAVARLTVRLVVVALAVSFASFSLLSAAPGDPAAAKAGFSATPERVAEIRSELGLDDPFLVRYGDWLAGVVQGNFGTSVLNQQPASKLIGDAMPHTVELMILAQIIALGVAIPAGVYSAQRPNGWFDRLAGAVSFGMLATPPFVLGIYLAFVFAVRLDWLPAVATDLPGLLEDPVENLRQMILPALTLASGMVAIYVRLLRTDLIETLQQDFVLMAQSRGYSRRRVLWRHAFRPSAFSLLTATGLTTAGLLGGALIAETLFAVPGVGRLAVTAIFTEDYDVVMGVVLLLSVAFVVTNFVVDALYTVLDPRVRHGSR